MSYPFAVAAAPDASRIAQGVIHRDVQTQVLATAQVRRDAERARRVPRAEEGASTRDRFGDADREAGDVPGGADAHPRRTGGRLDLMA